MTDCFALFDEPRRPWLDLDALKQKFHEKTLWAHPDAHVQSGESSAAEAAFTQLNEAYQTLADPKRRLQHLLTLEGNPPARAAAVPGHIADLFPAVAGLVQTADALAQKLTAATNSLSRSLLKGELIEVQARLDLQWQKLERLENAAASALQKISEGWRPDDVRAVDELQRLYLEFSYLTRWKNQLEEKRALLGAC